MSENRKEYWFNFVSDLSDLSLVHDLLFIRKMLDSPEVVESCLLDFFGDLEDMYSREIFLRYARVVVSGTYAEK